MYGLATDDSHQYLSFRPGASNPGRGWIMVRAPQLTASGLIEAMERGDFYSSTGVRLRDLRRSGNRLELEIDPEPGVTYTTRFIGTRRGFDARSEPQIDEKGHVVSRRYSDQIGEVLAEVPGVTPSYQIRGDELYVRAKIISSKPKEYAWPAGEVETAWTQPIVVRR
jgi:hypothetical protein